MPGVHGPPVPRHVMEDQEHEQGLVWEELTVKEATLTWRDAILSLVQVYNLANVYILTWLKLKQLAA